MELHEYFTDVLLVRKLCKKRIAQVRINRRQKFFESILSKNTLTKTPNQSSNLELQSLLPPRRHWYHFRPKAKERRKTDVDQPDLLTSNMTRYVIKELKNSEPRFAWARRLKNLLNTVREQSLGWQANQMYQCTRVTAVPKETPGNGKKYRTIAVYSLADTLIVSGFASYLRDAIEPLLGKYNFAFRTTNGSNSAPTHHDAFEELLQYHKNTKGCLWVSECDIKGFFDAVPHETVRNALKDATTNLGVTLDIRFNHFLESFLTGYNYEDVALPKAKETLSKKKINNPVFANPRKDLNDLNLPKAECKIGIPQGSFLSCILANLVLIQADTAARTELGPEGLYLRYCDDIIIMHRKKKQCTLALDAYIEALSKAGLPYHKPNKIEPYEGKCRKDFWKSKSRAAYKWSSKGVPWVGFVGYQAKFDGKIRIRRSSIEKERKKQNNVALAIRHKLSSLERKSRPGDENSLLRSHFAIRYRLIMHLLSIGVGYPRGHQVKPAPNALSWSNGFLVLKKGHLTDIDGLKILDRERRKTIKKVEKLLFHALKRGTLSHSSSNSDESSNEFRISYIGWNFCYVKQFAPKSSPQKTTMQKTIT